MVKGFRDHQIQVQILALLLSCHMSSSKFPNELLSLSFLWCKMGNPSPGLPSKISIVISMCFPTPPAISTNFFSLSASLSSLVEKLGSLRT